MKAVFTSTSGLKSLQYNTLSQASTLSCRARRAQAKAAEVTQQAAEAWAQLRRHIGEAARRAVDSKTGRPIPAAVRLLIDRGEDPCMPSVRLPLGDAGVPNSAPLSRHWSVQFVL